MDISEHFYEAAYQTWMRGGNPDRLSFDRAEHDWYSGKEPDYTAQMEINRQRKLDEAEGGSVLFRQPHVSGSLPLFKCKCGYETSNSVAWCVHADCCSTTEPQPDAKLPVSSRFSDGYSEEWRLKTQAARLRSIINSGSGITNKPISAKRMAKLKSNLADIEVALKHIEKTKELNK